MDVSRIVDDHKSANRFNPVKGRRPTNKKDQIKDFILSGSVLIQDGNWLNKYAQQRNVYLSAGSTKQELHSYMSPEAQPPASGPSSPP